MTISRLITVKSSLILLFTNLFILALPTIYSLFYVNFVPRPLENASEIEISQYLVNGWIVSDVVQKIQDFCFLLILVSFIGLCYAIFVRNARKNIEIPKLSQAK